MVVDLPSPRGVGVTLCMHEYVHLGSERQWAHPATQMYLPFLDMVSANVSDQGEGSTCGGQDVAGC